MSTTYGTQSAIMIPSDGDTVDAVDVNVPLAAVWDRHDFLDSLAALQGLLVPTHGLVRYVRGYGHFAFVTSGTYSASAANSPWILTATDGTAGRWVLDGAGNLGGSVTHRRTVSGHECVGATSLIAAGEPIGTAPLNDLTFTNIRASTGSAEFQLASLSADTYHAAIPINAYLIDGATFGLVTAYIIGASHAGLPVGMPAMTVLRYDAIDNIMVSLFSGGYNVDTSASVAAYEALHTISGTPDQNNVVDRTKHTYFVALRNEYNTNALLGLHIRAVRIALTAPQYA